MKAIKDVRFDIESIVLAVEVVRGVRSDLYPGAPYFYVLYDCYSDVSDVRRLLLSKGVSCVSCGKALKIYYV
jgi:hypothetical protein